MEHREFIIFCIVAMILVFIYRRRGLLADYVK